MSERKQKGLIVAIGNYWYVRYREDRNIQGKIERKRVSRKLGPITTRGKNVPRDIQDEAARHMLSINSSTMETGHVVTIGKFVNDTYLPWIRLSKKPSTAAAYEGIWGLYLEALCAQLWLKDVRTFHVQNWLDEIARKNLSRNTLKHVKSAVSGIFTFAKQRDFFHGENPVYSTSVNPKATEPDETYAYSPDEIVAILSRIPEPAATAFAVAAYSGLRVGEIEGLEWGDYCNRELRVARSIWNGISTAPKTRKSSAAVPVISLLANRLELHRARCGDPQTGPIFRNQLGKPLSLNYVLNSSIRPALNRCINCGDSESKHRNYDHTYVRNEELPVWRGWHAARRGLGSNLYRLGTPDKVIQAILRHSNVSTTTSYYVKTVANDIQEAMAILDANLKPTASLPSTWQPRESSLLQ